MVFIELPEYDIYSTVVKYSPGLPLFFVQIASLCQHVQEYSTQLKEGYLSRIPASVASGHHGKVLVQISHHIIGVETIDGTLEQVHDADRVRPKARSSLTTQILLN